jgi:hypothetical protein
LQNQYFAPAKKLPEEMAERNHFGWLTGKKQSAVSNILLARSGGG